MKKSIIVIGILVFLGYGLYILVNSSLCIAQQQATYVGIDRCKICHPKNFDAFSDRKFDKSWKILAMKGKTKDPECLKCHVTGYGQPGGFVSEEATPHLKYKQCEVCHAPASLHVSDPANKEYRKTMAPYKYSDKNVCVQCHICMKQHKEAVF